jgi:hypothetical protein
LYRGYNIPPLLLVLYKRTNGKKNSRGQPGGGQLGGGQSEGSRNIKKYKINQRLGQRWTIKDRDTFLKIFPKLYLEDRLKFNSTTFYYYRYATRAYCFPDCPLAASHGD